MQCDYFDARECRSCALMGQPYDAQRHELQAYVAHALSPRLPETSWEAPGFGAESHFRNKAKLAVGGTRTAPTFGILDAGGRGVDLRDCGLHEPGRVEKLRFDPPAGTEIEPIPPDRTLAQMLATGQIDALYSPRTPRPLLDGDPRVRRLFADPAAVEADYFSRTGIFPIMHVVVLRRDVYERRPWLARSLYKAFEQARVETLRRMAETAASRYLLPWLYAEVERTVGVMGAGFWTYGLDGNEDVLRTFLRYSYEQGLANELLDPADLFARETLESFTI